jgi:hypothetical protein
METNELQDLLLYMVEMQQPPWNLSMTVPAQDGDYIARIVVTPDLGDKYKDKEWISEMYLNRSHTMQEIADMCGVTAATINSWLVKYAIDTRSRGRKAL